MQTKYGDDIKKSSKAELKKVHRNNCFRLKIQKQLSCILALWSISKLQMLNGTPISIDKSQEFLLELNPLDFD